MPACSRRCRRHASRAQCQTGRWCIASWARRTSHWTCYGTSTRPRSPTVTATAGFASTMSNGRRPCRSRCARHTCQARSCSSTTRATGSVSSIRTPAKSARRNCSSPRSAHPTHTPKSRGRSNCRTGSARTCARSTSSAAASKSWSPTTSNRACTRRTSTIPSSTAPMARWPRIIPWPSYRHARGGPAIKQKVEQSVLLAQRWILARLRNSGCSALRRPIARSPRCSSS
jgi:hypothetical protein